MTTFLDRLAAMKTHAEKEGKRWFGHFEDSADGKVFVGMNRKERRDWARGTRRKGRK